MLVGMGDLGTPVTLGVLEHALFESAPPVTLGRFEILRQLGRGGMAVVWLARDPELKREVAIKVHRGGRTELGQSRLRREAESLARLRHRNVVGVYEVGRTDDGEVFVVMEHLTGPTLRQWIERERPERTAIVALMIRCARGLQAAHDAGLVHRDFKPDNVVIDGDGEPRIIDFGIASADHPHGLETPASSDDPAADTDAALAGTPRYMAPELWSGAAPSPSSDQFAFAVALFEALVGAAPFDTRTCLPRPRRPQRIPRRLWPLVERALDPMPSMRWPSLGALAERLASANRPRRAWVGGAAVVGAVVASVGAGALWRSEPHGQIAAPKDPCTPGHDYLTGDHTWSMETGHHASGRLVLELPAGPPRFVSARLDGPAISLRDRALVFELEQLPRASTSHEVFLGVRNGEDEAFSILVWGGQWVFPMAPNTHGLALEIDRTRDRYFRIQIRDQTALPDAIAFEVSSDGRTWTPIAQVEGNVARAQLSLVVGSHDPIAADDAVTIRSIRCVDLAPLGPLAPERDRARIEGGEPRLDHLE